MCLLLVSKNRYPYVYHLLEDVIKLNNSTDREVHEVNKISAITEPRGTPQVIGSTVENKQFVTYSLWSFFVRNYEHSAQIHAGLLCSLQPIGNVV